MADSKAVKRDKKYWDSRKKYLEERVRQIQEELRDSSTTSKRKKTLQEQLKNTQKRILTINTEHSKVEESKMKLTATQHYRKDVLKSDVTENPSDPLDADHPVERDKSYSGKTVSSRTPRKSKSQIGEGNKDGGKGNGTVEERKKAAKHYSDIADKVLEYVLKGKKVPASLQKQAAEAQKAKNDAYGITPNGKISKNPAPKKSATTTQKLKDAPIKDAKGTTERYTKPKVTKMLKELEEQQKRGRKDSKAYKDRLADIKRLKGILKTLGSTDTLSLSDNYRLAAIASSLKSTS